MDASQITKLLQIQNTRYINRNQTVDSSTLTWKNQIQSSKYIKGVKTCDGQQNCNVPTNPCCADQVAINGVLTNTGINSFGGSGRTTAIQTGSAQQFLNVLSGASGSASQVYSSESITLQRAGKESCGVSSTTTPAPQNTYVVLPGGNPLTSNTSLQTPSCSYLCTNTNGPTGNGQVAINNNQNPYLPQFDTYYAMKNPQCNYPVQDQNQKHFVKECHTRFPNANNGENAVFSPCNNVTTLDPITKQFKTTNSNPPTCDGCILEEIQAVPGPTYCLFCEWATYLSGTAATVVNEVVQDSQGNSYIAGNYSSTTPVTVKNVSGTGQMDSNIILPITTQNNAFLIKYSPNGQALWATILAGSGLNSNDVANSVTIDTAGNVIVAGQYQSNSLINVQEWNSTTQSIVNSSISLPNLSTGVAAFIIKYSSNGTAIWATILDATGGNDSIFYTTVDSDNNIYVIGSYFVVSPNTFNIYNGVTTGTPVTTNISLPPPGNNTAGSMFLAKYNSTGTAQWATYLGVSNVSSPANFSNGNSIAVDSSFNVYVIGNYNSSLAAAIVYNGTTSTTVPSASGITLLGGSSTPSVANATYLIKYTQSGTTLTASNATIINGTGGIEQGQSIAIDSSGNLVITGSYTSGPTIYNSSGNTQVASSIGLQFTTSGANLTFIVKYNTNLEAIWATFLNATTGTSQGNSITAGSDGYIYVTGQYMTPFTLMSALLNGQQASSITVPYNNTTPLLTQLYLVKYDINGQAVCATYIQTGFTSTIGRSVSVINNTIFVGGQYQAGATTPVIITDILSTGISQQSLITLPSLTTTTGLLIKYTQS